MGPFKDVYVFGDQTLRVEDNLQNLALIQDNAPLTAFLREAFSTLKREASNLSPTEKAELPQADTLGLLLDGIKRGKRHAALDSACTCIYEVGYYIHLLSQAKGEPRHPPTSACFLGLCIGSLVAAALSCSRTVFEISQLGAQTVAVAFRIGMYAHRKAEILGHSQYSSWSAVISTVSGEEVDKCIDAFCAQNSLPTCSQPYVSSIGQSTITVSGPPSVLNALLDSFTLPEKKAIRIPISGPYHAPQLYPEYDVSRLVASALKGIRFLDRMAYISNINCVTGKIINAPTFSALLEVSINNILAQPIRIDRVANELCQLKMATLLPVNTQVVSSLAALLAREGKEVQVAQMPIVASDVNDPVTELNSSKIAIVGFSGRFPEADDLGEFWNLLKQGLDVHKPIPKDRFDPQAHYDATGKRRNTSRILHGCWIQQPGLFDPRFFQLSPREACQTDPAQRLALLTAYEALEMAGFVADRTPTSQRHRVGVFYGTTSDDWREVNSGQDIDTYFIPGGNRAFIPGKINYFFKFSGPSISVDTACSSSLAAINIAITSLLKGDCDTAISGGTNIMTNPDNFAGLDRGHFLSRTGNCKPFDNAADGYCRADAVGTVILKRFSDAIADKDPIFGVILGAGTNHSAESVSITRPLANAQEYIFNKVLSESGLGPHDIDYIEMHGTGTQAGDAVEMQSVLNSFAWDHTRQKRLYLESVKANIGHSESASGVSALIKVLLMMQKNRIPPHCGIKGDINHGFPTDLTHRGVHIATKETDWARPNGAKRRAFVNNFSAAGGNTALLLEDGLETDDCPEEDLRRSHIIAISARSTKSLKENLEAFASFIGDSTSSVLLAQMAYTTTARRMHHGHRVAIVTDNMQHLRRLLLEKATGVVKPVAAKSPRVGFLFTGQGAQQMAPDLYLRVSSFGADIRRLDAIGRALGLPSVLPLVDGSIAIEKLPPTVVHLGACVVQIALARLWINLGLRPQYVVGHSLGEYAALHVAGVLSIADTIWLCGRRAALLEMRCIPETHGMLAVKSSASKLVEVLEGIEIEVACINGPGDTVLSGRKGTLDEAAKRLQEHGIKFTPLALPFAFHSSQVEPILDELEEIARTATFHAPALPIVSPLLATVVTSKGILGPKYIRRHCRETVNFFGAVESARQSSTIQPGDVAIEISAHPLLTRMINSIVGPSIQCYPSLRRGEDAFKTLPGSLGALFAAGITLNWDEYYRNFDSSNRVITLPSYNWDYDNYWIQYEPNWCLTKGEAITTPSLQEPPKKEGIKLSSSVQKIVEQGTHDDQSSIIMQSDIHDPELLPIAQDHRVNGLVLCPSSLYADIAYTLANHLLSLRFQESHSFVPDICNMSVEKAIVVNDNGPQFFRASMNVNWKTQRGDMELYSVDQSGKYTATHARCSVGIQRPDVWLEDWQRNSYLIKRSIKQLLDGVGSGSIHKIRRGMAYKLFASEVQYGPSYQAMEEATFDSEGLEATARVRLQPIKGQFSLNPCWADSFGHLTGFLMNTNDSLDLSEHVFINHGWAYMRCSEPFSPHIVYQTYVKMQPLHANHSVYSGDVYILRDNEIIAVYGAVKFNRVPRRVLQMMLPSPKKSAATVRNLGSSKENRETVTHPQSYRIPSAPIQSVNDTSQSMSAVFQQALRVISKEIGIDLKLLTDDTEFINFGVDSLMSLTILGALRESLDMEIPELLFDEYPSVGALKGYFLSQLTSNSSHSDRSPSSMEDYSGTNTDTTITTVPTPAENNEMMGNPETTFGFLLAILSDEIGISSKELLRVDELAEIGLDSLSSLSVLGRAREELGLDLPHDFFLQHTKVSEIKTVFNGTLGGEKRKETSTNFHPPATSVILQGRNDFRKRLFLFPDGSGSSTSYATLPRISPDLCVVGLNCPYMKSPEDLKCSLQDLTDPYVAEIRRRQPRGPYNLAGWSAGGIAAYDTAQSLVDEGEIVEQLILLDSPNPVGLEKLPPHFYKFLEGTGVFGASGGQEAPSWLIQHFLAFIDALDMYKPMPFRPSAAGMPKTTIIWATDGVCKTADDVRPTPQPGDTKEMRWLLENRTEFGFNGWDTLLGDANITIRCLEGANHFSMVRQPCCTALAAIIREAIESESAS